MTGTRQVLWAGRRVNGSCDGRRTVSSRDTRRNLSLRADGYVERCTLFRGVIGDHWGYLKLVESLTRHGKANKSTTVGNHEVDGLGCGFLRCDDEVTLVLAILVVNDYEHLALTNLGYRILNRAERAEHLCSL